MLSSCAGLNGSSSNQGWLDAVENPESHELEREPGQPKHVAVVQREVMDYSDAFSAAIGAAVDSRLAEEASYEVRVHALAWKLKFTAASMEIASGPDPRTNILDMAVFISAGKWAVGEYWLHDLLAPIGPDLRAVYEEMDRRIWDLCGDTLTSDQTQNLQELIKAWTEANPQPFEVSTIRFRNLEGVNTADFQPAKTPRGLLANVRRWLGQVNTSLLFSERLMFYLERSQRILAQQSDLTIAQVGDNFPLATVHPDFEAVTSYLEQWPGRLQEGLTENKEWVSALLPDVNQTLGNASQLVDGSKDLVASIDSLAANVDSALTRLDALAERASQFDEPPMDPAETLDSVRSSLSSLEASVAGLNQLLAAGEDQPSPVINLVDELEKSGDAILDRLFAKALWLLAAFFTGAGILLLLAGVIFRRRTTEKPLQ